MNFVIIGKDKESVPSDEVITKSIWDSGGTVIRIEGDSASKKITFTGKVNHTVFQNNLRNEAGGKETRWNFDWRD